MKHIKMISVIIIVAILCAGCTETKDESSVPEVTTTTATTTTSVTTTATTTAVTTSAQTTAETEVTDQQDLTTSSTVIATEKVPNGIDVGETVPSDPVADQIAQECEENIPVTTPEEADKRQQDKQNRQDMADNTAAYTTEDIPLTTRGSLTAPARPTASYKLPENAQLEFTGNPETALLTELPEGCFWTPERYGSENAFMDPAGNIWLNTESDLLATNNEGEGYYSPDGTYHFSQAETDRAIAFNQQLAERDDNGPTGDGTSNMSKEEGEALADLFGFGS